MSTWCGLPLAQLFLSAALALGCATPAPAARHAETKQVVAPEGPLARDIVYRSKTKFYFLRASDNTKVEAPEAFELLRGFNVICFGESHDKAEHHYAQWVTLRSLLEQGEPRRMGIGFEMFQQPFQPALEAFRRREIMENDFLLQVEYEQRWGFDFSLYRPLLELGRELGAELLALNAPRELTKLVARSGLAGVDPKQKRQLPRMDLEDAEHRAYFMAAMAGHPMDGSRLENMYAAQVLWDEFMASGAVRFLDENYGRAQLFIVAGNAHCQKFAIPKRIARRRNAKVVGIESITESEVAGLPQQKTVDYYAVFPRK